MSNVRELRHDLVDKVLELGVGAEFLEHPAFIPVLGEVDSLLSSISSINATKTPLLISIKDAFSEANKQIHSDYELIQQEAIKLGECASMITEIERNLKSARKIGAVIRENVVSVFSFSGAIFNRLSECKSMLDKISSTTDTLRDSAEKINLLGLNLSIIAQKMGGNSAGADTLASQIRLVSRQIAVATVDIDTVATTLSKFISESQSDNAKIGEISEASKNATGQIDSLSGNSWSDVSNVGSQMLAVATSLRSNVSSSFDSDSTMQDIDDIKDSIKDMASIVKKAGENVEVLRSRIK
jgi:methyl-accepting chemotaxis protein